MEITEILNNIFVNTGYRKDDSISDKILYVINKQGAYDYWIVEPITMPIEQIRDWQSDYQDGIEDLLTKNQFMTKNLSVLICTREDVVNEMDIVEIENNPYFFKKYVLQYNDDDVSTLANLLEDKSISELLMDPDQFKKLEEGDGCAKLLYSIAHKLPFIELNPTPVSLTDDVYTARNTEEQNLLDWINSAPSDANELSVYIDNLINTTNDYED